MTPQTALSPAFAPGPTYYEEPGLIVFDFTFATTAGGAPQDSRTDYGINIDKDSDFLLTNLYGSQDGSYKLNFKLPTGRSFANVPLYYQNLVGSVTAPTFIGPSQLYRAGSRIPVDLYNNFGGTANTIQLIFGGIRRYTK